MYFRCKRGAMEPSLAKKGLNLSFVTLYTWFVGFWGFCSCLAKFLGLPFGGFLTFRDGSSLKKGQNSGFLGVF